MCVKRINIITIIFVVLSLLLGNYSYAINVKDEDFIYNVNPYYNYWKNNFIMYIDNYNGDINNVSINDLNGNNGSSNIYIFSKLADGNYDYDKLLSDIKNSDVSTNLHDKKPILIHLPKSAVNSESHALLKDNDEKGKLVSGGPYSKYSSYKNGFYYKDKLINEKEVEKLLKDYETESSKISEKLKSIKSFSIKDIYKNVHAAYMTNGATNVAGTKDAKIYLLNVDKELNPYNLKISDMITSDVITGEATKNYLPKWETETIYIYDSKDELVDEISFFMLKQYLWSQQETSIKKWMNSLNN